MSIRYDKIKKIYENKMFNDLYKKSDLEDELLGSKEESDKELEDELIGEDDSDLASELLGEKSKELKPPQKMEPQVPHRLPPKQIPLFPEEKGTLQEPSKFTSGEIMGKVCLLCGHKNFPGYKTTCERCNRLYKQINRLIEDYGYTEDEAIEEVAQRSKSLVGPTTLRKIYQLEGNVPLPKELEELKFTDPRGLTGTPNVIKLKNLLENRFNVVKDKYGEPAFDEQGMPIPLPHKERRYFSLDELAQKLLLGKEEFLDRISSYNEKLGKEVIKPAAKINENLQIFNWSKIAPVFKDRIKDLVSNIIPKRHMEKLQKRLEWNIKKLREAQDLKEYWTNAYERLYETVKDEKQEVFEKIPPYMRKRFRELSLLRKNNIKNEKRNELEKAFGDQYKAFKKELEAITDESQEDREKIKNLIGLTKSKIVNEQDRIKKTQEKMLEWSAALGKPISDVKIEGITPSDLEKEEDFSLESELGQELLGKSSRLNQLRRLFKLAVDQPFLPGLFEEPKKKEEEEEKTDPLEQKTLNLMERKNVSREEAEKELSEKRENIIKSIMEKRRLNREDAEKYLNKRIEHAREIKKEKETAFTPKFKEFEEPKEREELSFSEKICPYCEHREIFEGSEICNFCKANIAPNKKNLVVKRTMWALVRDKNGDIVINEETGKPKRRPIPMFSLVTLTMKNDTPIKAEVKKVSTITPDVSKKTLEEKSEFFKRKPKIRVPGQIGRSQSEFKETGEHKLQIKNCPQPWENADINKYPKCEDIKSAVSFLKNEALPNGVSVWPLKDVIDIKEPIKSTQKRVEVNRMLPGAD